MRSKLFVVFAIASLSVSASPLRVSLPPMLGALPVALAERLGYFAEEGIPVQLVPLPSQRDRILAFQAGQIDALVTDLTSALLLVATQPQEAAIAAALFVPAQDGSHLALLTPANYSRLYTLADFLARASAGRVQIAVPRQSDLEYALDQLLARHGVRVPPEWLVGQDNLLLNATWLLFGMTAVGVLPQPYVDYLLHYEFEGKPELRVLADFAGIPLPPDVLVVRRSLGADEVRRFLAAVGRAAAHIRAMAREELIALAMPVAIALFFPGVNLEAAAPEDRARVEAAVEALRIPYFPDPRPVDPEILGLVADWARKKGYLARSLSYAEAVWPGQ
ncbi:MAG: ABC transporter substrate-binding protein [Candidatus Bipolaricaulota bacterium]|nr:ABC transporter substrate-binding protein [Candidatus Bipolaricaulota bacterium]MDW8152328.1 ABC transporter substrate-binding protein [Candidatus Bipolaricaulota bacterium]